MSQEYHLIPLFLARVYLPRVDTLDTNKCTYTCKVTLLNSRKSITPDRRRLIY